MSRKRGPAAARTTETEAAPRRVTCNPLDLAYRYQDQRRFGVARSVSREAADPSVVHFQGRFYLFASMSGGFWHSTDLVSWEFVPTPDLPGYDYAPDVRVIGDALVVTASRTLKRCPVFRSTNPLSGQFELVTPGHLTYFDPHYFQDDDGRVYLYWGCSNTKPIQGVEVDPETFAPIGEPVELISGSPETRGWERMGENHRAEPPRGVRGRAAAAVIGTDPYIEGAWMTKHGETYYLQYSAPATEHNTYADGYFTGTSPLGPFTYSPDSPFSSKPGGFITGAGHGSTFQDGHGNWWHAATMRVSVNQAYERRVGVFPAGFDDDGTLFCNQEFADYPFVVPDRPFDPWSEGSSGWMLQSLRAPVRATSSAPGHGPELAVDEDVRTAWVAGSARAGEALTVRLSGSPSVHAVQINLADHELHRLKKPSRFRDSRIASASVRHLETASTATEYLVEVSADGEHWDVLDDTRGGAVDSPHRLVVLDAPRPLTHVRITGIALPYRAPLAVSGLRVFGQGEGEPPRTATANAVRVEDRNALVRWTGGEGAHGFNVRYGRRPDRLYHCWQVPGETSHLDLSTLTAGEQYWVAVDAFNENGVTRGEPVPVLETP